MRINCAASTALLAMISDQLLDRGRSHGQRFGDAEWLAARAGLVTGSCPPLVCRDFSSIDASH
ncbi:MAG: hypothetical protein ACPGXX_10050 [Planctomycetaceae bacterium]